jgi:hypothetical protein
MCNTIDESKAVRARFHAVVRCNNRRPQPSPVCVRCGKHDVLRDRYYGPKGWYCHRCYDKMFQSSNASMRVSE